MYAAGRWHRYGDACVWVMTEVTEQRIEVAGDTEIIQEILYRYGALQRRKMAVTLATSVLDLVPLVHAVTTDDARVAVSLFEPYAPQGVKARDVLHVAVMRRHGPARIISADRYFDTIEGLNVWLPLHCTVDPWRKAGFDSVPGRSGEHFQRVSGRICPRPQRERRTRPT